MKQLVHSLTGICKLICQFHFWETRMKIQLGEGGGGGLKASADGQRFYGGLPGACFPRKFILILLEIG